MRRHVQIDETSHPIDGDNIIRKYGRVTKTNIQLEQVYVVHLDSARALSVKDTWDWSVEDENSLNDKNW